LDALRLTWDDLHWPVDGIDGRVQLRDVATGDSRSHEIAFPKTDASDRLVANLTDLDIRGSA
jgi:hypothetical protein